jgi:hypothetical protein
MLLWDMMHFENKIFYKISLHEKLFFSTKYHELHILHALYLIYHYVGESELLST